MIKPQAPCVFKFMLPKRVFWARGPAGVPPAPNLNGHAPATGPILAAARRARPAHGRPVHWQSPGPWPRQLEGPRATLRYSPTMGPRRLHTGRPQWIVKRVRIMLPRDSQAG